MDIRLKKFTDQLSGQIRLNASKSESNRALIIQALSGLDMTLTNLSNARDTETMSRLLKENSQEWDVLDAGTTMRFCTAYLAVRGDQQSITGTDRMKQRPIEILVEALRALGSKISYGAEDGFPPMTISKIIEQQSDSIEIPGNVSSQYISALLMIAPTLSKGLKIKLTGEVYSRPYIEMTLGLMEHFGVNHEWTINNVIHVPKQVYRQNTYRVEGDWSGASYWYSLVALAEEGEINLDGLNKKSFQGDQAIVEIMEKLGVSTTFSETGVRLSSKEVTKKHLTIDFRKCPDLAQTVMVVATVKGVLLTMTGLESLKIKETDRVAAMQNELLKIGGVLEEDAGTWNLSFGKSKENSITIDTYEDHRMAMAFAPLCMISNLTIKDREVVNKSYPDFWKDFASVGVAMD